MSFKEERRQPMARDYNLQTIKANFARSCNRATELKIMERGRLSTNITLTGHGGFTAHCKTMFLIEKDSCK